MSDLVFKPGQAVDPARAMRRGALAVAEYRVIQMAKWASVLIAFGVFNPVIYLLAIGFGIGSLVDANSGGAGIDGVSYLQFVAPALLATAAINTVNDEVSFPTMQGFLWDKMFFAINNTPVKPSQIVNGIMMAAMVRVIFTVLIYEAALVIFGAIPFSSVLPLFLVAVFVAISWGAGMFAFAVRLEKDEGAFALVARFVITPLFLFSGTFYPLEQMPIYLQWIGWISPLWHSTQLGRSLSYGMPLEFSQFAMHVGFLVVLAVVGMALVYPKFAARLSK